MHDWSGDMIDATKYKYVDGLETKRLVTKFLVQEDAAKWTKFLGNHECTRFFPMAENVSTEKMAEEWIAKQLQRYSEKRYGLQALIDKQSGEMIGQCGLLLQEVDGLTELEVGYHIFRENWGKGYAPEAAKIFIDYAFHNKLASSVISIIHINNLNSQRVAAKNNLLLNKQTVWRDRPVFIFRKEEM